MAETKALAADDWYGGVPRSIVLSTLAGIVVVAVTLGAFGTWAMTAPLAAAVIAEGTFVATGQNRTVQHLEGGIVREIRVREGERVERGDILMVLDDVASRANARRMGLRVARLEAAEDRLSALIAGKETVSFDPVQVPDGEESEYASLLETERAAFVSGRNQLQGNVDLVEANIRALEQRKAGVRAEIAATSAQLDLLRIEERGKAALADKGFVSRTKVYEINRLISQGTGTLGRLEADLAGIDSQIARGRDEIDQLTRDLRFKANDERLLVLRELDDVREQLSTANDVLGRVAIRSPIAGTLVDLKYNTIGAVIEGGREIMEILPAEEKLMIEAPLKPADIDSVAIGQPAAVRLTSYNQRTTPSITGTVVYLSADTVADQRPGQTTDVYVLRVEIEPEALAGLEGIEITPGMPADIFVTTDERTFFDYITKPIRDSMDHAFRES